MAVTRFSTPFQISRPTSVVNEELYDRTMHELQSKYDEGYLNIQKSLESYNALDLVKPEDIAYRDKKVAELTDKLDGYGNVNLADPKEVIRLQREAAGLSKDKQLMSAVNNTANYRQLIDRYSKLKENPKLIQYYDPANEYADMKQVNSWLNGESPVLGIRSPTLKTDVDKIAQGQFKNMKPTAYSYVNGMYIVNGEMLSEGDLTNAGLNIVQGDANVQGQLMRNADYAFRDATPEQMFNMALSNKVDMIAEARTSLNNYENQLKDASIDATQRAGINNKINQLKANITQQEESYRDVAAKYNRGETSDLNNLKYEVYANKWIKSQVTPFVVNREKITPNQAAVAAMRESGTNQRFNEKLQFDAQQGELNRNARAIQSLNQMNSQLAKVGKVGRYDENGNLVIEGGVASSGVYQQLPTLQPDGEGIDAVKQLDQSVVRTQNDNKLIINDFTKNVLEDTDPALLSKIKPLLDGGNIFDNKTGKFLGDQQGISQAQIDMLRQYDELLDNAKNPDFLKNSPLLSSYGNVVNQLNINQMKWNSLENEKSKAINKVYNDAKSKGEFKGTLDQFNKQLEYEAITISTTGMKQFGNVGPTAPNVSTPKFIKQLNDELNKSTIKNEFLTAKVIGEKDEIYNNPENGYNQLIKNSAFDKGVYINGKLTSVNGNIQSGVSYGADLSDVEDVVVTGIIPNTDQVRVNLMYRADKDKKDLTSREAVVQLNPADMNTLIGRNSQTYNPYSNFDQYLINGQMQDKAGKPLWFNLNGDVPDMTGNLQYRVWNFDGKMSVSLNIPTPNGDAEVKLKGVNFNSTDGLLAIKTSLSKLYINTRAQVIAENPNVPAEQIGKLTLEKLYNTIK